MEITLNDLIVLEPRLCWGPEACEPSQMAATECGVVSWLVSARATAPHLPHLRGGEVLLVPPRVIAVIGGELTALLREARLRDVTAVVFERGGPGAANVDSMDDVTVLRWDGDLTPDTETGINRLLTECRGNLYRVGSQLEREMTDLTASRSSLRSLVQTTSDLSGLPVRVIDDQGRLLAGSHQDNVVSSVTSNGTDETRVERALPSGLTLVLGPLRPEQRVIGRFLVDRIAVAVTMAARQDEAIRPRGARRIEAVEALLARKSGSPSEQQAAALALGLDPDAIYLVAVSSGENDVAAMNVLAPLGSLHAAGEARGCRTVLVAASGRTGFRYPGRQGCRSEAAVAGGNEGDERNTGYVGAGFRSRSTSGRGRRSRAYRKTPDGDGVPTPSGFI